MAVKTPVDRSMPLCSRVPLHSKLFGRHGRGLISYIKEAARLNDEGIKLPPREKNTEKKENPELEKK